MQFRKVLFQRNNLLILFAVVLIFACVGCQKNPDRSNLAQPEKPIEQPVKDNKSNADPNAIVRVCQSETPPANLDPLNFDNKQDEITFHIFDRLVKWDSKGNIIPDLAKEYKSLSKTKYQFKLRSGITFHNGEPFDARAVKFTIDRIIDAQELSPGASLLSSVKRVEIVDPYTVNIYTSHPDYLFIRKLSLVQILPENYFKKVGKKKFSKKPIGTGAYEFEKYLEDGSIVLKKNKNYWRKGKPIIEKVVFKFIKADRLSRKEQLDALFRGDVDLITELPGLHSLRVSQNPGTKVVKFPNGAKVHKLLFNSLKKPFSDIKVRKAVNVALNRDVLINVLAKGNGRKIATNSVKLAFGHNSTLKPYPYNPKEALELLKEAGYKELYIKIAVTEETKLIAEAVKKDLERINIKSDYDVMTVNEMSKRLANNSNTSDWDYDLAIYSGVDPFLHVGFLYGVALYSKGPFSKTRNKEVDELYEELVITLDEEKQKELCYRLETLSYDNYWYTPVFQVIGTYGVKKDLQVKDTVTSFVDLTDAYFKE